MAEQSKQGKQYASPLGASEHVLSDGRIVTPGSPVTLDNSEQMDQHNKRLIDDGQLIEVSDKKGVKK